MKKRIIAAAVAATLIATAPNAAQAQSKTSLVVAAGATAPTGTLGDFTDIGYNVAAGLDFGVTALPVGLRLEGGYNGLAIKSGSGDGTVRIISGTINGIFNLGPQKDAPYLIAGVGAYNRNISTPQFGYGNGNTVLGLNAGGGLRFPLSGINTFFEARYHVMLGNSTDQTNYQFIPITFGVMF